MPKSDIFLKLGSNILFISITFFSLLSIFSINYGGLDNSYTYIIVIILSNLFFYFYLFKKIFFRKKITLEPLFFGVAFLILLNSIFVTFFFNIPTIDFIFRFALLVLPAFFFGMELGFNYNISSLKNHFLFISALITISVIVLIPKIFLLPTNELLTFFGGGQYQAFSYAVSISFLISFTYFNYYLNSEKILIKIIFFFSFLIQILGIVLSGGRGGIIVVIIGTLWIFFNKYSFFTSLRYVLFVISIVSLLSFILISVIDEDLQQRLLESSGRLFSYFSQDGFDFQKTSNRDIVYNNTVRVIQESPIYGYGLFGYLKYTNFAYPHNFFLEILLQGGIIFFCIWILSFYFFINKFFLLISFGNDNKFLIVTFTYSFVLLMFSGSYILEPFFWFNLSYVISSSLKKTKNI